ncbi:MAG: YraN family protein [Myxococcota bacterium]
MSALSPRSPEVAHFRGQRAEDCVADRLEADGWRIRARNWRAAGGELDLVAERAGVLRFVEVKARDDDPAGALLSVSHDKQRRLRNAGNAWLAAHGEPACEVAFLVALVDLRDDRPPEAWAVDWWDDAF